MTPQLFRNYYLKSVEYMPWRVLCCQFVNTFVDDVAAYVIRMPKMHRYALRCKLAYACFFGALHGRRASGGQRTQHMFSWPDVSPCRYLTDTCGWFCACLRMSVFRDDIVFLILMYQRWLYRNQRRPEETDEQELKKIQ